MPAEQPAANALIEQLRESLGLLQVAFDAATEAMLILDEERKIRWANQKAADLWGRGLTPLLTGKPFAELVLLERVDGQPIPPDAPTHPLQLMRLGDGERRYRLSSGQPSSAPQLLRWTAIQGLRASFVLLIIRDLGPLETALLEQRRFVNRLAHELRTPLAILSGSLHQLARKARLPGKQEQRLQQACEEANRMGDLLDKLLVLSELDSDQFPWCFEAISLRTALESWIQGLPAADSARIKLNLNGDIPDLVLDPKALEQVLSHLLQNSLRFSNRASPVQLTASAGPEHIEIQFSDWGPGIGSAMGHSAVFDRFTRLEEHRDSGRGEGAGLGLSVVRSLMEGMGGEVFCRPNRDRDGLQQPGMVVVLRLPKPSGGDGVSAAPAAERRDPV